MRVAVYARVSTEHEAQINALENQLEWYKIECSRHSDWEIVEVYVDQGITGTQAQKRPEFLRMMEDARKDKFDLIITREVSRFARNTVDALSYTRQMKAMGVDVLFINDGINTAADDGELRLSLMSSMAQDESRKISERVKAGQKISRERHILYGNGNILGFRRENGTYVPEPEQAETVRLIVQMYSSGEVGLQKIVAELYRLGRLDAGGHVSWDASKVSRVLHNATYKGYICYNKSHSDGYLTQKRIKNLDESSYIYVKGNFEPLVSEEMWERCQQILASRSARVIDENGKKHKYMRNTPKSVWTAKLRCSCGAGFIQFKWRVNRDGAVIHGFQCYRRTRRPSISYLQEHGLDLSISCQIKAISEWKLDLMAAKVFEHLTFVKGVICATQLLISSRSTSFFDARCHSSSFCEIRFMSSAPLRSSSCSTLSYWDCRSAIWLSKPLRRSISSCLVMMPSAHRSIYLSSRSLCLAMLFSSIAFLEIRTVFSSAMQRLRIL